MESKLLLPFSFSFQKVNDFLVFEKKIRKLLDCQSSFCSFLQSTNYKLLKFYIQNKLNNPQCDNYSIAQRVFYIPNTSYILCLLDNNSTVILFEAERCCEFSEDFNERSKKRQYSPDPFDHTLDENKDSNKKTCYNTNNFESFKESVLSKNKT